MRNYLEQLYLVIISWLSHDYLKWKSWIITINIHIYLPSMTEMIKFSVASWRALIAVSWKRNFPFKWFSEISRQRRAKGANGIAGLELTMTAFLNSRCQVTWYMLGTDLRYYEAFDIPATLRLSFPCGVCRGRFTLFPVVLKLVVFPTDLAARAFRGVLAATGFLTACFVPAILTTIFSSRDQ